MALRLRVISDHRHRLGDKSTFVFGVSGGSIGRSAENDWVLPDDMRYVSGRHARIVYPQGPLHAAGHQQQRHLHQRQRTPARQPEPARAEERRRPAHRRIPRPGADRLGHRFHVSTTARSTRPARRARAPPRARQPKDLGASLRLENLLEASNDISSDELKPVNAFGQAVSARTRALHQTQDLPKEPSTAPELDVDSEAVARRIARLAKAAAKQQQALQQPTVPPRPARARARARPQLHAYRRGQHAGTAGVLPRRRHRPRNASSGCALAHAASRRPAPARIAAGPQGKQSQPAGAAQPAARDLPESSRAICCPRSSATASMN